MDAGAIAGCFRDKSILITGSTGFLGKLFVEKILRVGPDVKKLYLLVRAADIDSAEQRVLTEVTGKDLFNTIREKHGASFQAFIQEKLVPLAGDIIHQNFGLDDSILNELSEKIDAIVHVAATTNFYERYDVALTSNVLGVKHVCQFSNKCTNLKMLLHVSTVYVGDVQEGLLLEVPFQIGETPSGAILDIEDEFKLVDEMKMELLKHSNAHGRAEQLEKTSMKELGIKRTLDTVIAAYGEQALPCFIGEEDVVVDAIPGDMVVNAMIVAMAAHWNEHAQTVYHVSSSLRNPVSISRITAASHHYYSTHPQSGQEEKIARHKRLFFFNKYAYFCVYMFVMYRLPLEILHMVSILSGGLFYQYYQMHKRSYNFSLRVAKLYAPYVFFKGCFDDSNTERLRTTMRREGKKPYLFDFDPRSIDWDTYLCSIHIPGLMKHAKKK